ncbi:MAG: anthranilate/aminodeoxychorismate synthase component [Flavipsychrobacter sp.]|jgi:anthranilate synthase/aminodeoxychorismate synthase-like glutamine amidotransferase|nr:anthranilate/aminodeoxychorismate synthase component [Flavipsychrobacter sp.]
MWILLDNYDSFTYILHHYLLQTGNDCVVYRNDELTLQQLADLKPSRLIISPGPETPLQAGICMDAIARFHDKIPILGVCLGHQALGMFFGAKLVHAKQPMHGKTDEMEHNGHPLFRDISSPFTVMRYHSLVIEELEGTGLQSIAQTEDGTIMALVHEKYPCTGIQFHPESIGSPDGLQMLMNWAAL